MTTPVKNKKYRTPWNPEKLVAKLTELTIKKKIVWNQAGRDLATALKVDNHLVHFELRHYEGDEGSEHPYAPPSSSYDLLVVRDEGHQSYFFCARDVAGMIKLREVASSVKRVVMPYVRMSVWFDSDQARHCRKILDDM